MEFKIDLEERFPHLAQAPIVEAVIDIRAVCKTPMEQDKAMVGLREQLVDYPVIVSHSQVRQEVKLGPEGPVATTSDLGWQGFRFESKEKLHVAQFNRDGFVFSRL